jgi:predicted alpha/beta superfamily hydrolase
MAKTLLALILIVMLACNTERQPKPSTAQPNVTVLEQVFTIKGLDRPRQLRLYLPPDYQTSQKKYPVVYMHDGQNLFDDSTAYAAEWGVDETLNDLAATSPLELIVVGIDNGLGKRMNELSPWQNDEFGKAEGEQYVKFIVEQVKPFMDSAYRTLPGPENTLIMGSSMGGLISHYAIQQYPTVFGKVGIFSPSYWYSQDVYNFVREKPLPKSVRVYIAVGKHEGAMVDDAHKMYDLLVSTTHSPDHLQFVIDPQGDHNEASWRKQFAPAIRWLMDK